MDGKVLSRPGSGRSIGGSLLWISLLSSRLARHAPSGHHVPGAGTRGGSVGQTSERVWGPWDGCTLLTFSQGQRPLAHAAKRPAFVDHSASNHTPCTLSCFLLLLTIYLHLLPVPPAPNHHGPQLCPSWLIIFYIILSSLFFPFLFYSKPSSKRCDPRWAPMAGTWPLGKYLLN